MKIGYLGKQNSFATELLRRLSSEHPRDEFVPWLPGEAPPSRDLEVLLAMGKVGSAEFQEQPNLGLLQMASAGYEEVDVDAATKAGIWVSSAPTTKTGNGESVAEFAVLLMLAASRRLNQEIALTRSTIDTRSEPSGFNRALFGKTVCIVGLGGIGDLLVERLRGFGMILSGVDKNPEHAPPGVKAYEPDELTTAVADADYVVLAVPATKESENMIDAQVLKAMKKQAVLVNVARGTLVDEAALLDAVTSGHLFGAGLDVVKNEPVRAENPLLSEPRIFVTPHIAGPTDLMLDGTAKYLAQVLNGYRNRVRPESTVNEPKEPRVALELS